jgi:hypothetical protein
VGVRVFPQPQPPVGEAHCLGRRAVTGPVTPGTQLPGGWDEEVSKPWEAAVPPAADPWLSDRSRRLQIKVGGFCEILDGNNSK